MKIRSFLLFALSCALTVTVAAEDPTHDGHRYRLFDDVEDLSWQKGRDHCAELGGHLVVVNDAAEFDFIKELCDGRYMYLGATDETEEGVWRWLDGSEWGFERWSDGQPNNYGGKEDYLATYDGGEWVDVDASGGGFWMPTGYICEWDATEEKEEK